MKINELLSIFALILLIIMLIAIGLTNLSCGKHEEEETQQQDRLAAQSDLRDRTCASMDDSVIEDDGDRATFSYIATAFCPSAPFDVSKFEYGEEGYLHRNYTPVYPENFRGECSPDMFIFKVHDWITRFDAEEYERVIAWLEDNEFVCGEGDEDYTDVTHLAPLLYSVGANFSLTGEEDDFPAMHNDYLIAAYIHAKGRMEGYIGDAEKEALRALIKRDGGSPIFLGLYYRYHNGDQEKALDAMEADFPCDHINYRGWGSAPCKIIQAWATAILEGK